MSAQCVCVYLVQVLPGGLLVYGFISLPFVFIFASLSSLCRCFLRHGFAAIIKRHKEGEQQNETKSAAQHGSKMKSKTKSHIRYERAQHKCQVLTSCSLSLLSLSPSLLLRLSVPLCSSHCLPDWIFTLRQLFVPGACCFYSDRARERKAGRVAATQSKHTHTYSYTEHNIYSQLYSHIYIYCGKVDVLEQSAEQTCQWQI